MLDSLTFEHFETGIVPHMLWAYSNFIKFWPVSGNCNWNKGYGHKFGFDFFQSKNCGIILILWGQCSWVPVNKSFLVHGDVISFVAQLDLLHISYQFISLYI